MNSACVFVPARSLATVQRRVLMSRAVRAFIGSLLIVSFAASAASADRDANVLSHAAVQLAPAHKAANLRQYLPKVDDPSVQAILDDPALILYTKSEIPTAYQDWSSGLPGIHSPSYNVSANDREPFGNGNIEFPWGAPGGAHRAQNVATFRFLWLPRDELGRRRPIVWYRKHLEGSTSTGYAWTYPVGAVVGEVLQIRSPQGQLYTFELRVRKREQSEWVVDVFRPFPSSDELAQAIRERRANWQQHPQLAKLVAHLEQPRALPKGTLMDAGHTRLTFHQTMGIDSLPPVGDDALVVDLLTKSVFKSALGATWRKGTNKIHTVAPTTHARFHIVPAQYDAGFIEVDRLSCMRCHETVNRHVNDFQPGRDWYGRVRGSDGIFSIHPFDPSCISNNGISRPAQISHRLTSLGIFAAYNPTVHSREHYQKIGHLR
jgi:hypothetical protein